MDPSLLLVGLSHRATSIELRERLYFDERRARSLLREAKQAWPNSTEFALLSTCNRTEIYTATLRPDAAAEEILSRLSIEARGHAGDVREQAYVRTDPEALSHLFRVTASLDSMVPGETQISGQVRDAYRWAAEERTVGPYLHRVFQKALHVAKRIRRETQIGRQVVSLSHAAVELARKVEEDLSARTILVIGTGEMGELAARQIGKFRPARLLVTSRSLDRAAQLAREVAGEPRDIHTLNRLLEEADVVIASAAVPEPLVTTDLVRSGLQARRGRPLVLIDLGMPRNIEPDVHRLEEVFVYNLDDLERVTREGLASRREEAVKGGEIIREAVEDFVAHLRALDLDRLIVAFRRKMEALGEAEIRRVAGSANGLDPAHAEMMKALAHGIVQKFLHQPVSRLKANARASSSNAVQDADDPKAESLLPEALVELFDLKDV
ncbi:MAG: glutamyl-tRNA reductase [Nitrospirae bacterium]|nr:glutamyl-tRNA reductase [Nitrospirota bacterium]